MKLLASVLSVAAADYACCPYDEYGIPDPICAGVLTEKSPFAEATGALVAEESYACKAWEANAGAALENHKASATANKVHDWGSCGFQRHFPWYNKKPLLATDPLAKIGLFDTSTLAPNYEVFGTGGNFGTTGANWNMLSLTQGSFSGATAGSMPITGEVHLGGVCKLFVPVQKDFIRQVSIAGVHINNARVVNGLAYASSAEMNAVILGKFTPGDAATAWSGSYHAGTAYCFSVVNIAEFMTNRANFIANANVAGTDTRTPTTDIWNADDQGLQYKTDGSSVDAQFGTIWPGYATDAAPSVGTDGIKNSGQHKVNMGSNFDVVVHFDSAWCSAHWQLIDMQKTGTPANAGDDDHGAGSATFGAGGNLQGFENLSGRASEAKMDAWDKRLPGNVGSCGLCKDRDGVTRGPVTTGVISDCTPNTWTADNPAATYDMDNEEEFDYNGGVPAFVLGVNTCTNLNGYSSGSNRWPNAGAWAAFYSFVTCARSDYMIYNAATRTFRTVTLDAAGHTENAPASPNPSESATHSSKSAAAAGGTRNNDNRMVIVGGWHQDYRHGRGACVRFNLRQVGEYIHYCSDGDEEQFNSKTGASTYKNPTGDTQAWSQNKPMRCTWNWNYNALSSNYDAEAWFDSIDPLHMQVWSAGDTSEAEEFIDEPQPGSTGSSGYQAAVKAATGTLTSDVVINVMLQERRRSVNGQTAGAFVAPNKLEMDAGYAADSELTAFDPTVPAEVPAISNYPALAQLYDQTSPGVTAKITLSCNNSGKYNGGATGAGRMRDHFPDCFFGDEIHGQWTWDTADMLKDVDSAANTAVWRFYAMLQ